MCTILGSRINYRILAYRTTIFHMQSLYRQKRDKFQQIFGQHLNRYYMENNEKSSGKPVSTSSGYEAQNTFLPTFSISQSLSRKVTFGVESIFIKKKLQHATRVRLERLRHLSVFQVLKVL